MVKEIGNVKLNYEFYKGNDVYSDGEIEDELLDAVKHGEMLDMLYHDSRWPVLYHFSDIRENIIEWFPMNGTENVLEIGSGCGAITGVLSRKAKKVTCIELSEKRSLINAYRNKEHDNINIMIGNFQEIEPCIKEKYDLITLIGVWEYSAMYLNSDNPYEEMLKIAHKHLKKNGKIFVAVENKTGLKYWNGAREDHTGKMYSGLNDYSDTSCDVRTFSKKEIEQILDKLEMKNRIFYYPNVDYKMPDRIYSDELLPNPGEIRNFRKDYDGGRIYNFTDAIVADQVCYDKMFPYFSNSYCFIIGKFQNEKVIYVKYNKERRKKFRIKTEIKKDFNTNKNIVIKKALNIEAIQHIERMKENEKIANNGLENIKTLCGKIVDDSYIVPMVDGIGLDSSFYELRNDSRKFVLLFKNIITQYLTPNDNKMQKFEVSDKYIQVFGNNIPKYNKCLEKSNIDLIFSNIKQDKSNKLYCFDAEWCFEFLIPYKFILWRSAEALYLQYFSNLKSKLSFNEFIKESLDIDANDAKIYKNMEKKFYEYTYGKYNCELYTHRYKKSVMSSSTKIYG